MRVLIVGSLDGQIGGASQIAIARGAKVLQADDIDQALATLRAGHGIEIVLIDLGLDIRRFTTSLARERINLPVVACGTTTDAEAAVSAIKAGAKEFIPLPPDADLIAAVFEAVAEENHALIHADPAMEKVIAFTDQIAASEASVLITGESGTGKEVLARYIHRKSRRADRPFVTINCAAIPDNLLESELFGYEKGAFTGAVARRIGKFEEANGGSLLFDEVSEMDPRLQAKLLRAIQEREIDRLGGNKPIKVDIRVIATSNRNLEAEVRRGHFREDLYFRLNVIHLDLPPLRARPLDIEVLARHFAQKYADLNGVPNRPVAAVTLAALKRHPWRGNVRELENVMHRAVLLAKTDEIGPEAILLSGGAAPLGSEPDAGSAGIMATDASGFVGHTVAEVERDLILSTLNRCLGNRTHAANILGISIRTLRNKLKQYSDNGVAIPMAREASRVAG